MKRHDGGPAFPGIQQGLVVPVELAQQAQVVEIPQNGMSVRDYFAAHAPIRLNEARDYWFEKNGRHYDNGGQIVKPTMEDLMTTLALMRGLYADSMIAERGGA